MFKRKLGILTIVSLFLVPSLSYADTQTNEDLQKTYKINSQKDLNEVLKGVSDEHSIKNNSDQYELVKTEKDELGYTHYTLKPKADGYFAENSEVKIHTDESGKVVFVNGDLEQGKLEVKNDTKISKDKAIDLAFKGIEKLPADVKNLSGKDVVQDAKIVVDEKSNRAVYSLDIIYTLPEPAHWTIKVDAENGNIVDKQNVLEDAMQTTGTGIGSNGEVKSPLNLTEDAGNFYLLDTTHKGKINTMGFKAFEGDGILGDIFSNPLNSFNDAKFKAGVDAHYFTNQVYNYYKDVHNRDSYDGKGADINSYVNVPDPETGEATWSNAAWTGAEMIYGDGDQVTENSFTAANDVVAHEITHGVTSSSADLVYRFQPGALNESFSDVFGYFVDSEDWLMGEDLYKAPDTAIRSLKDPKLYGQPDNMKNYKNYSINYDRGGVHINSGIPNKAAYNTINKLGKEKSEQIYYRALTKYLTSTSNFLETSKALSQSAKDLYGTTESLAVTQAWRAVGVE
ncbi:M4 family metallopeptidase [Romboutsia sedimentorum]|uniref:Neutral metalloproteinase n=1 Tax=Romboutsia sedimentorum TaxID=1368474 RepID=A0ABT7EBW1_9FIRM|nr:M4 family metallopeptidase [Romboutsia sedimentorum]MDK2564187.1 M4 family metallopeptidase [Romboutsia sedimentorum]